MKNYQHLFFDLDHTLWDFERSSAESLVQLYHDYQLNQYADFSADQFVEVFSIINKYLWDLYNRGQIEREKLRKDRFVKILTKLGVYEDDIPRDLSEAYVQLCPTKPYLMPFAKESLDYLLDKGYKMHIITNGFEDVQHTKMRSSGIHHYFDQVVTSDKAGKKKPYRQIFDYALSNAQADRKQSIMIGDNLQTDIGGAKLAEMDHIFYNPFSEKHRQEVQIEITCLSALQTIF